MDMMELSMPFLEDRCRIDGQPLVHDADNPGELKCLNEQQTHHYHWPDKDRNSGWVLKE